MYTNTLAYWEGCGATEYVQQGVKNDQNTLSCGSSDSADSIDFEAKMRFQQQHT